MKLQHSLILVSLACLLAGCEQLGLETPAAQLARDEAEGNAIGGGCRLAGRGLEDCYQINKRSPKAAIYTGWRDMDAYMRDNKLDVVKPESLMQQPQTPPPAQAQPAPLPQSSFRPLEPAESGNAAVPQNSTGKPISTPAKRVVKS